MTNVVMNRFSGEDEDERKDKEELATIAAVEKKHREGPGYLQNKHHGYAFSQEARLLMTHQNRGISEEL
eukprot:CAMPEP_0115000768 /NCGR_PEP_ID=MMETSP0216-20121206/16958_1 /TAXON_ID=223996 /ORGANISM="Protocruzia adherens, Strain Boccale" /LENGTH=68 /DNA_ID=CAMNT_0002365937 /DNA_START=164 /DNA_END=370 /DNA_ORIENTATION=-